MGIIRRLPKIKIQDKDFAGGKGAGLGELSHAGLPVPPGFVVGTKAYTEFLEKGDLENQIDQILRATNWKNFTILRKSSRKICNLILETAIPAKMSKKILRSVKKFGKKQVAVRSSATLEDASKTSWAGQFATFLNTNQKNLLVNIKKCWASLFSPKALSYLEQNKLTWSNLKMAVIVQEMVQAEKAGVAFSANPLNQNEEQILIEATPGAAQAVVAGKVVPDRYILRKKPLLILKKELLTSTKQQSLQNPEIFKIARIILKVEKRLGYPVDLEWALKKNKIYILQARPITRIQKPKKTQAAWSNVNIEEVLPGINPPLVTSLLIDLLVPVLNKLLGLPRDAQLIRSIKGRPYFNLALIEQSFSRIIRTGQFSLVEAFGGRKTQAKNLPKLSWGDKRRLFLFGTRVFFQSFWAQRTFKKRISQIPKIVKHYQERIKYTHNLNALSKLKKEIHRFGKKTIATWFQALFFPLSSYFIFRALCKRWLQDSPVKNVNALLTTGLKQKPIAEIEGFSELWDLSRHLKTRPALAATFAANQETVDNLLLLQRNPELYRLFKDFLDRYGHRCAQEINFSVPRWHEDPTFLLKILKKYIDAPESQNPRKKQEQNDYAQKIAVEEIKKILPFWKMHLLKKYRRKTKKMQQRREHAKSEMIRLLGLQRQCFLKIGKLLKKEGFLDNQKDIFMLTLAEINQWQARKKDLRNLVRKRKKEYQEFKSLELPDIIYDPENPARKKETKIPAKKILKGTVASSGTVRAKARIIHSLAEIDEIQPGEILITDHTDPGWTPLFVVIAGIVTNTGGVLSHASIVAREYGLPAIVNVEKATKIIQDGQEIFLDGNRGIVKIL